MAHGTRYSRDFFTGALQRIAEKIDRQQEYRIEWHDDLLFRGKQVSRILAKGLWAVGSWARGALECGDLDLVLDVTSLEGHLPFERSIRGAVSGGARYVRIYIGTPEKNSSGATFDEAVLIWSPTARDWKSNIQRIKPNPTVTRFTRKTDELPLRPEQLQGDEIGEREKIVDLRNEGYLSWDWVALDSIAVQPEKWSEPGRSFHDRVIQFIGKKTQRVLPFIIQYFENSGHTGCWGNYSWEKSTFKIDGSEIIIGRPHVSISKLELLECSALILVPHLTSRGPNGLWIIRRGDKHPVTESLLNLGAYVLYSDGEVRTWTEISNWRKIRSISLFRSEAFAQEVERFSDGDDSNSEIRICTALDILNMLSKVDIMEIDGERFAITIEGSSFDKSELEYETPRLTVDSLKELLIDI